MSQQPIRQPRTLAVLTASAAEQKDDIKQLIKDAGLRLVHEKKINLTTDLSLIKELQLTHMNQTEPGVLFVLESKQAVRDWLAIVKSLRESYGKDAVHGSASEAAAKRELGVLQQRAAARKRAAGSAIPKPGASPPASTANSTKTSTTTATTKTRTTPPKQATRNSATPPPSARTPNARRAPKLVRKAQPAKEKSTPPAPSSNSSSSASHSVAQTSEEVSDKESEHDAEVAAATHYTHSTASSSRADTPPSTRASFSPNSVASLPRPETPEVDQLRHRFESMSAMSNVASVVPTSSPRPPLTEIKTKPPAGSRVKSMVEFFMDENLHKWEF
ncbi:hypothetical protein BCR43DRAFT_489174 [Syncephalastrum racemosum]|uniref:Nucleoside diphosphate kinase n=1 Tax=Syncephalastrum racemosum TaxID=13706 RepID=A0A1X2HJT0_SYNRA|nr:hypothetical protein BCR43DRAFT_489174 [Syncephalastrum racemosum]